MQPLFSIIIPAYNVSKFIKKCVNSLTNDSDFSIEIIIVNDASTDETLNICQDLAKSHTNIRVIDLEKNSGQSAARNIALKEVKGEYVFFIDGDDTIPEGTLSLLKENIVSNKHPEVILGAFNRETKDEEITIRNKLVNQSQFVSKEDVLNAVFYGKIKLYAWSGVYKLDYLRKLEPLFPTGQRYEDIKATTNIVYNSNNIYYLNEPVYNYFDNNLSTTRKPLIKDVKDVLIALRDVKNLIGNNTEYQKSFYVYESNMMLFAYNILCKCKEENNSIGVHLKKILKERYKQNKNDLVLFENSSLEWTLFGYGLYEKVIKFNYWRRNRKEK